MESSRRWVWIAAILVALAWTGAEAGIVEQVTGPAPYPPLSNTISVAVSPDGEHVYTAGRSSECGVGIYHWDGTAEELQFVGRAGTHISDLGGSQIVVSPDGAFVYLSEAYGDTIAVYSRDPATGELTQIQLRTNAGRNGLAFSADGAQLYSAGQTSFHVFDRDAATGLLSPLQDFEDGQGGVVGLLTTQAIAASGDGTHVYVTSWHGRILTFSRDPVTGLLSYEGTLTDLTFLRGASHVILSSDDAHLYVAGRTSSLPTYDGYVSMFSRDPATGSLTRVESHARSFASGLALSPAEDFLYAGDTESGEVGTYARDPVTGMLTPIAFHPIGEAYDFAMSPGGEHVFLAADGLVALARDAVAGTVSVVDFHAGARSASDVVATQDGNFVYVEAFHSIAVYSRDPVTEELTPFSGILDGLLGFEVGSDAIALSPDDAQLYAAGYDKLSVLDRDPVSGELSMLEVHGQEARTLTLSPDGAHVYATTTMTDELVVFARDLATGLLSPVETESLAAQGLDDAEAPALSPDGLHLYVPAEPDALAVYARDPSTGELDHLETYFGGQPGFEHLVDLESVLVTADGGQVIYVANKNPEAVGVLSRDAVTGELSPLDVEVNGAGGVTIGLWVGEADISPDGSLVFVTGQYLTTFRRHADGHLSFVRRVDHQMSGIEMRPDGAFYGFGSDLPSLFDVTFACAEAPLGPCKQAAKSKLTLRDQVLDAKDRLSWVWSKGDATTFAEISPNDGNHYALCFYDESDATPTLLLEALAPADQDCRKPTQSNYKPCWSGTNTAKYFDPFYSPDGLQSAQVRPSIVPKSRVKVKGKGAALNLPAPPLALPLRVQLQSHNGVCWESTFSTAKKNEPGKFKANDP